MKFVRSPYFLCNSRDFLGFSFIAIRARNGTWFTENGSLRDVMKEGGDYLGLDCMHGSGNPDFTV